VTYKVNKQTTATQDSTVESTATIVTIGSILEMEKYKLYICVNSHIVSRLQAGGAVESNMRLENLEKYIETKCTYIK